MDRYEGYVYVKGNGKKCDEANIVCSPKNVLGEKRNNKNYTDLIY